MKICFLSKEYPPETHAGGIGTYTYNMATAMAKLGHEIHVITSGQRDGQTEPVNGVWVHRVKSPNIKPYEFHIIKYSYAAVKKLSQLNRRFDIVQASEFEAEGLWLTLKKTFPLVTRLATPRFLIENLNGKTLWGPRPLLNWFEKRQSVHSRGLFTSTRALAEVVSARWHLDSSRVAVIPNSVDLSRVVRLAADSPAVSDLKNEKYLLYFGRLEERKGVRILARALPAVLEEFPDLRAVFVGRDLGYQGVSMREHLEKILGALSHRVTFLDNLPQERLFPIVGRAQLVVLPSLWEAFGFVCVEALALGRPVIATSGSGFEEIIEDNLSGYLVEPGDSRLLARKMIEVLGDEHGRLRISEGARLRAQDFEVSGVALRLLNYYHEIRD